MAVLWVAIVIIGLAALTAALILSRPIRDEWQMRANQAREALDSGDSDGAELLARQCLKLAGGQRRPGHPDLAGASLALLGVALHRQGRSMDADESLSLGRQLLRTAASRKKPLDFSLLPELADEPPNQRESLPGIR